MTSRVNYSDEEDYPGQSGLFQANCDRSLRGKKGQAELRELKAALLALPEKYLLGNLLYDDAGGVCAIGAYGKYKGVNLATFDPEEGDHDEVGIAGGMPRLVAWKVVEMNDIELETAKPEQRYRRMLAWIERLLHD